VNDISKKLTQIQAESFYLDRVDYTSLVRHLLNMELLICQVKAMLNLPDHKQKTWDQKEESQEVPQEHVSSTHNNDQRLPEKEQSQKIVKTSKKQYIISYPHGATICQSSGESLSNCDLSEKVLLTLRNGGDVTMPNDWKVQVIDL